MTQEGVADSHSTTRRTLLRNGGAVALSAGLAGCSLFGGDEREPTAAPSSATLTGTPSSAAARRLAERYAPDLFFDGRERWFPTDPRPHASTVDGERVVDGFDALEGYTTRARERDAPPDPTLFFRVVEYSARLAVVQYWLYSAFDQFTTNFHWHDWELLQVFVDRAADRPVLFSASAHARRVPNNEHVDPAPTRPAILSELGSHSSALGVNQRRESFQRLPADGLSADITNRPLTEADADGLPFAYGLPRDEGLSLPFAVPELDGAPLYEHERLPSVTAADLLPADVTVRSFDALASPPSLPARESGLQFAVDGAGDVRYDLVPTSEVENIARFSGPQLSFEFAVPTFAEDVVASHLTTTSPPWGQPRYDDPVADVTDPAHRGMLAERFDAVEPGGAVSRVFASLAQLSTATDVAGEGLVADGLGIEGVVLLESDPVATPTWRGRVGLQGVPPGEHRLTVNAPGIAPYSEHVAVADAETAPVTRAGIGGRLPLVANEDAVKVEGDARDGGGLSRVRVADDNAGPLYDAPPVERDRFGLYVHRDGAYVVEVRDRRGRVGAARVRPAGRDRAARVSTRTGKGSLVDFLDTYLGDFVGAVREGLAHAGVGTGDATATSEDGRTTTSEGGRTATTTYSGPPGRVVRVLVAARQAVQVAQVAVADRAADRADERIRRARERLDRALAAVDGDALPPRVRDLLVRRLPVADRYAGLALDESL